MGIRAIILHLWPLATFKANLHEFSRLIGIVVAAFHDHTQIKLRAGLVLGGLVNCWALTIAKHRPVAQMMQHHAMAISIAQAC